MNRLKNLSRRAIFEIAGVIVALALIGSAGSKPAEIVYEPSPYPVASYVPSPYPVPSPYAVEGPTVYGLSTECQDYLTALEDETLNLLTFITDVYEAYLDYPDEDLLDFGRRVEDIISTNTVDEFDESLADDCWSGPIEP
jgi:hypothetical protein